MCVGHETKACADPEIFMRGGPTKMVIFGHKRGGWGGPTLKTSRNYPFLGKMFKFQGGGGVRTPPPPLDPRMQGYQTFLDSFYLPFSFVFFLYLVFISFFFFFFTCFYIKLWCLARRKHSFYCFVINDMCYLILIRCIRKPTTCTGKTQT